MCVFSKILHARVDSYIALFDVYTLLHDYTGHETLIELPHHEDENKYSDVTWLY